MNQRCLCNVNILAGAVVLCMATSCADKFGEVDKHGFQGWPFRTQGEIFSLPFCAEENIYFGTCEGSFYCVDKELGSVKWKRSGFERIDSAPVVAGGNVYFASVDNRVLAFSARDGSPKWVARIQGVGYSNPKVCGGALWISADNQLVALNPETGEILHRCGFKGEGGDFSWNSTGLAVVSNRKVSSHGDRGEGTLSFFPHGDDTPLWTADLGGSCLGRISCDEGHCYVGARNGVFHAYNTRDGSTAWQIDCSQLFRSRKSSPVWADDHVAVSPDHQYVIFTAGHQQLDFPALVVCAGKNDGKILWKVEYPIGICGVFDIVGNTVVAVTQDRQLLAVDVDSGTLRVSDVLPRMDRAEFAGVKCDGDFLFVAGADAHVYRLSHGDVLREKTPTQ